MSEKNWKDNAKAFFAQCYECDFNQEHEFTKGKTLCQVIGFAIYGEPDEEIDEKCDDKFGYSTKKADHIFKIQNVCLYFKIIEK